MVNKIEIENPLYYDKSAKWIMISSLFNPLIKRTKNKNKKRNKNPNNQKYTVEEQIIKNDPNISVNIVLNSLNNFHFSKGQRICQMSVIKDSEIIAGIRVDKNPELENNKISEYQAKRKAKFNITDQIPKIKEIGTENLSAYQKAELEKTLRDNNLAFSNSKHDIGLIKEFVFTIPLKDEHKTVNVNPRIIPMGLKEKFQSAFKEWEDMSLVEESFSNFNNPLLCIFKKRRKQNVKNLRRRTEP